MISSWFELHEEKENKINVKRKREMILFFMIKLQICYIF